MFLSGDRLYKEIFLRNYLTFFIALVIALFILFIITIYQATGEFFPTWQELFSWTNINKAIVMFAVASLLGALFMFFYKR